MIAKGQKRKSRDEEDAVSSSVSSWQSEQQSVLGISLVKYQRVQELAEPSLLRSVLIANTLRNITKGIEPPVEVVPMTVPVPPTALSTISTPSRTPVGHFPLRHCPPSIANCPSNVSNGHVSAEDTEEDWGAITAEPDFSISIAISSILKELDATIDGSSRPQAAPRLPFRSLENLPGPGQDGGELLAGGHKAEGSRAWESMTWGSVEVMASGYLQDVNLDDLFQDIDTSVLETDMGALGVRALSSSFFSSTSSCLFSQELLRYLPSLASTSSSSCSASHFSPIQDHRDQDHCRELSELDHFMEILVEF